MRIYADSTVRKAARRMYGTSGLTGFSDAEKHDTLYDACVAAGLAIDSHESDMYLLDTPKAVALIVTYRGVRHGAKRFRSAVDGNLWWDVPFAFAPFWRSRCKA